MVLPSSHQISRVRWYSFVTPIVDFAYETFTPFGAPFQKLLLSIVGSFTVGLFPVRSPLLRESSFLSFPPVTEMFQFTGSPLK